MLHEIYMILRTHTHTLSLKIIIPIFAIKHTVQSQYNYKNEETCNTVYLAYYNTSPFSPTLPAGPSVLNLIGHEEALCHLSRCAACGTSHIRRGGLGLQWPQVEQASTGREDEDGSLLGENGGAREGLC